MSTGSLMLVTDSKTFTITDYSIVKRICKEGGIQSTPFTVGGYEWVIEFYPQGINSDHSESISVYVRLLDASRPVKARYSIRMKNWVKKTWSLSTPAAPLGLMTFERTQASHGYSEYLRRADFMGSDYLKDDTIEIKCTLWVQVQQPCPDNRSIAAPKR